MLIELVGLAVAVGAVEVATMVPYLAAIEAVSDAGRGWGPSAALLMAYVLVTLAPALLLLVVSAAAPQVVSSISRPLLRCVDRWSGEISATVLLVVGALVAADAAMELNLV